MAFNIYNYISRPHNKFSAMIFPSSSSVDIRYLAVEYYRFIFRELVTMAANSKAQVYGLYPAGIAGSNHVGDIGVFPL
jgi:hypothetical protein